jgi:pteridine reductase
MAGRLFDKVALVTGAGTGIGEAAALALAREGAAVALSGRRREPLQAVADRIAKAGGKALVAPADLGEQEAANRIAAVITTEFGRLDILVNNASSFFPVEVGEIEASHWEELVGSNLRAPLFIAQEAAPELARHKGSIINIVDIHAERPLKGYPLYSVAKAGLAALTRSLAVELAPAVRVNGVAPGAIAWPEDGQFEPAERDRILATTPLARIGSPDDVAQAVHFLACAPYVTGQIIAVDGGRSLYI